MANVQTILTVQASANQQLIVGAQVFVNGINQGVTDSNGQITLTNASGTTYQLSVKSPGYVTFTTSGIVADQPSFTVGLEQATSPSTTSFTLLVYPEKDAANNIFTFSNGGSPVTQLYQPGGITLTLGAISQEITATVPNYNAVDVTFDLSKTNNGTITMIATTDSGFAQKQQTIPIQDPDTAGLLPQLTPEASTEFIASNTGQGTYFTMTQARMYIGGLFVDELNSLQFALQDNKIPIYGYASRFYDALAQGRSLVQGQFTINFVSEGYLLRALQEYQKQLDNSDSALDKTKTQQQNRLTSLVNALQNPDPAWTPTMIQNAINEVNNLAASLGGAAIDQAKAGMTTIRKQQDNNIFGYPGGDYPNAIYEDIGFDIVVQFSGAGRTITRRLEDCHLISNESVLDHNGSPILDSYGFIARRLR